MPTPGMEDYLEQMYILTLDRGYTRVTDVAEALGVHTSSVSRMARKLGASAYIVYEKYGRLSLTEKGLTAGKRLLERHEILEQFLELVGVPDPSIVDEVERMEHYISWSTINRIHELVQWFHVNPEHKSRLQSQLKEYIDESS
ncbi:transcriptional regulator MntR [Paenibacillus aquistagni]|uniref:Manganese transport regulator n=1 Tax=Paenibacillus aquistagni TaxID=1852522 RepID=A0A1X7IWF7_9BACL|nr:transcriptional regulator MntR [Paenibacillus aquistagni]SMG19535.1 iron (metal) dependent repressor, DtxR family [Paenibacillus aquistagni]